MLIDNKDALTAVDDCNYKIMSGYEWIRKQEIKKRLKELPSAEPQIIRCKDCKWYESRDKESSYGYCHAMKHCHYSKHWEISIYRTYNEDFFCADAERREEE